MPVFTIKITNGTSVTKRLIQAETLAVAREAVSPIIEIHRAKVEEMAELINEGLPLENAATILMEKDRVEDEQLVTLTAAVAAIETTPLIEMTVPSQHVAVDAEINNVETLLEATHVTLANPIELPFQEKSAEMLLNEETADQGI
jgi:hypothetical protein